MSTIEMQRSLVVTLKKETLLTVKSLSRFHPLETGLNRDLFKDNALDKLTQKLFNHLSYYLVSIIDNQLCLKLPWPLYDAKSERAFRNGLAIFINAYTGKGLSPVLSSYLINPSCYKVTLLIYQMSQLALETTLKANMKRESQKKLYNVITECYKSQNIEEFKEVIEKETDIILQKFSNYMCKREKLVKIAEIMSNRITDMESKISSMDPQNYINILVDGFVEKYNIDDTMKKEILAVKNVHKPAKIFETWLLEVDKEVSQLETEWDERMGPFLKLCSTTQNSSKMLIDRISGKADKSSYTLEYNPKIDNISSEYLESQVNSEQRYILKNIVKNNQLNFPNLIRGYLVAVSFVLRNSQDGDDMYKLNEYLEGACGKYSDMVISMRELRHRVTAISSKLKSRKIHTEDEISPLKSFTGIPPLPDLSDLKMGKDFHHQIICDAFTPLNVTKHHFNLRRKTDAAFTRPHLGSHHIIPAYQGPSDDFLRSLISYRITSDRQNTTQRLNMSSISQSNFRNNETIASCSSGFTKEQVMRLLSTKKSSSSKKFRYKSARPNNINIERGGLFNESYQTVTDNNLYRSYSSPNLSEHRDNKLKRAKKMSVMQENSPLLEVSGICMLEKNNTGVPNENLAAISRKLFDANSLPVSSSPLGMDEISTGDEIVKCTQTVNFHSLNVSKLSEIVLDKDESKTDTTKTSSNVNSLESIINRYKKVRASVIPSTESKNIVEEKENLNVINMDLGKKISLPDLLSPSCSGHLSVSTQNLDNVCIDSDEGRRPPRESLGTVLGVDHTFLDQFELID